MIEDTSRIDQELAAAQRVIGELYQRISELESRANSTPDPSPSPDVDKISIPTSPPQSPNVLDKLLEAEPKWVSEKERGNTPNYLPPRPTFAAPTITRSVTTEPDVDTSLPETVDQTAGSASIPDINFIVSDATITEGNPPVESNRVLIATGRIKDELPASMFVGIDYIIDLIDPADSLIYAGATFNPQSLAITSRFLGVSGSGDFPESRIDEDGGFLYWELAYTYFDEDGNFQVKNKRVGDIDFELVYGSMNGLPALLPVDSAIGWLSLT